MVGVVVEGRERGRPDVDSERGATWLGFRRLTPSGSESGVNAGKVSRNRETFRPVGGV